jgi:predicted small secreted protein
MSIKNIFSFAASIISLVILILFLSLNSKADINNIKYYSKDEGILSLMYHRFDENKYPSTNIQMEVFVKQIEMIKNSNYEFYDIQKFIDNFNEPKKEKKNINNN